ncbi:hypothetical protein DSO57_1023656 [Entomophthora muscae]|uniref:Uncharacterized protein n=1 Tax=Entomophthora muscae TaxID=34485 RepID=A0ACC2S4V4_9FUNG|nr:hypothetical protein DSO57_1023656 [Entomophthora muscae]
MLEYALQGMMVTSLVCNGVALGMILRQDTRQLDLKLALTMTLCDLILCFYKVGEAVYMGVGSGGSLDAQAGQWEGVVTTFLLQLSVVSVGFLAGLRFWVIFLKWKVNLRVWWAMLIIPQVVMLGLLIAVALEGQFERVQLMATFYPSIQSRSPVVGLCRHLLMVSFVWPVVVLNFTYPCIARLYESLLRQMHPEEATCKQRRTIYFKIIGFVLIYDTLMIPNLIILVMESITNQPQSATLESMAELALFSMTFFNPLVLLALHHETLYELKASLNRLKYKLLPF